MNFEKFIKNNEVEYSKNIISNEDLQDILLKNEIQIGKQLKEYILQFGYLAFKQIEFYGINGIQKEKSDLIKNTLYLNRKFEKTKNFIAIENKGDGEYYLVDSKDNVYRYLIDNDKLERQNLKFFDYILKRFEEIYILWKLY